MPIWRTMPPMKKPRGQGRTRIVVSTAATGTTGGGSRFDADKVLRLVTLTERGRFEMQFSDAEGRTHVLSLPLPAAVQLGCLICDVSETAPYLVGGIQRPARKKL